MGMYENIAKSVNHAKDVSEDVEGMEREIAVGLSFIAAFTRSKNEKVRDESKRYLRNFLKNCTTDVDPDINPGLSFRAYLPG
jgi:hypothetical protein